MAEFPGQGFVPSHVPPHIPTQHAPRMQQRKRKEKPPASLTKLQRPLIRFYCNDCKKKFRSRILANRNNNAVQHYCSLYTKIITRKVDSHSNKCKGDHGMGPCVVKRTDNDPDSDGEDETKAAYYADKGKARPAARKPRGAYTRKRKRSEPESDGGEPRKRQRPDLPPAVAGDPNASSLEYYPPPNGDGYYHPGGYLRPVANGGHPLGPPRMHGRGGHHNGHNGGPRVASTPTIPMPMASGQGMPPPPALEPIEMEEEEAAMVPVPMPPPPAPPLGALSSGDAGSDSNAGGMGEEAVPPLIGEAMPVMEELQESEAVMKEERKEEGRHVNGYANGNGQVQDSQVPPPMPMPHTECKEEEECRPIGVVPTLPTETEEEEEVEGGEVSVTKGGVVDVEEREEDDDGVNDDDLDQLSLPL